jgi:hypothetical protein
LSDGKGGDRRHEIFVGWLLLISGIAGLITTFGARHAPGFWWSLLSALRFSVEGMRSMIPLTSIQPHCPLSSRLCSTAYMMEMTPSMTMPLTGQSSRTAPAAMPSELLGEMRDPLPVGGIIEDDPLRQEQLPMLANGLRETRAESQSRCPNLLTLGHARRRSCALVWTLPLRCHDHLGSCYPARFRG